jgi:hypothetical protein
MNAHSRLDRSPEIGTAAPTTATASIFAITGVPRFCGNFTWKLLQISSVMSITIKIAVEPQ